MLYRRLHTYSKWLILVIFLMAGLMTVGHHYFTKGNGKQPALEFAYEFEEWTYEYSKQLAAIYVRNLILISHTLPSSIYIAIEMLRYMKLRGLAKDKKMLARGDGFYQKIGVGKENEKKAKYDTTTAYEGEMIENLGSVDLLLTDKTGTLTKPGMRLAAIIFRSRVFNIDYETKLSGDRDLADANTSISVMISL